MNPGIVFVDSYTCEPFAQEKVLLALEHAYRSVAAALPGFLGAAMLLGTDHSRISAVVRFATEEDLMRLRALPAFALAMAEVEELASGHDPRVFHATAWVSPTGYVDL